MITWLGPDKWYIKLYSTRLQITTSFHLGHDSFLMGVNHIILWQIHAKRWCRTLDTMHNFHFIVLSTYSYIVRECKSVEFIVMFQWHNIVSASTSFQLPWYMTVDNESNCDLSEIWAVISEGGYFRCCFNLPIWSYYFLLLFSLQTHLRQLLFITMCPDLPLH